MVVRVWRSLERGEDILGGGGGCWREIERLCEREREREIRNSAINRSLPIVVFQNPTKTHNLHDQFSQQQLHKMQKIFGGKSGSSKYVPNWLHWFRITY